MKGGKRGRRRARDVKYSIGVDMASPGSNDASAIVASKTDPVDGAIEVVFAKVFDEVGARRTIKEDLEEFGFRSTDEIKEEWQRLLEEGVMDAFGLAPDQLGLRPVKNVTPIDAGGSES